MQGLNLIVVDDHVHLLLQIDGKLSQKLVEVLFLYLRLELKILGTLVIELSVQLVLILVLPDFTKCLEILLDNGLCRVKVLEE